jgi:predicted unusual protein kinase regulating ubiquinone biosynthesis (AarF/ABC1/UbiB family)/DNA-binding XRE family transcriptional regulator
MSKTKTGKNQESKRLIRVRKLLDFSQREMAEELGVVHGAVGLWEANKRKIPGPVLKLIALYEEELGIEVEESKKTLNKLITKRLNRNLKIGSLAGALVSYITNQAVNYFKPDSDNQLKDSTQLALVRQIVDRFSELKGLPQKIGQYISYMDLNASDEIQAIFSELQNQSKPLDMIQIVDVFLEDFGKTPKQIFKKFNPHPFSAASIGQVHLAEDDEGEKLAVKVQYPGIKNLIQSDIKNLKALDKIASLLVKSYQGEDIANELAERCIAECNYLAEKKSQDHFREIFKEDQRICIPKINEKYSSEHILTSTYIEGISFDDFIKNSKSKDKDFAGEVIWDHAFYPLMTKRIFNGDSHPGNFLFKKDQVVFLDYGFVKEVSEDIFNPWKKLIKAILNDDPDQVREISLKLNFITNPEKFNFTQYYQFMRKWYKPCYTNQEFQFTKNYVGELWLEMKTNFMQNPNLSFPKEFILLSQLQWGLYALLSKLESKSNWSERFLKYFIDD